MKKTASTKLLALSFGLIVLSIVGVASAASGWTGYKNVRNVYAGYTSGMIFVGGLSNKAGCSNSMIRFDTADTDPEKVLKLVIAAKLSGKRLSCNVNGCTGNYQRGYQCLME